jgi:hypothetical protein
MTSLLTPLENRYNQFRSPYPARARNANEPLYRALSYRPRVQVVPDRQAVAVAAKAAYEGRVTVPVGSALWAISASSSQAEGFKLNILDGGSGAQLVSPQSPQFGSLSGQGSVTVKDSSGNAGSITSPLFILPKYQILTEPGQLRVQITNLSASVNNIQVALHFAAAPRPDDPRNQWNDLLDAELQLARRAIRNLDLASGQPIAATAAASSGDPMSQPATNYPFTVLAASLPTQQAIVNSRSGMRLAIHQLSFYSSAVQNIRLIDSAGNELHPQLPDYKGGFFLPYQQEEPHFVLPAGLNFVIDASAGSGGATGNIVGFVKVRLLDHWGV